MSCEHSAFLGGGIESCRNRNKHSLQKVKKQQCYCSFPTLLWLYCLWDWITVKNWLFLVFLSLSPDYQGWFVADWLWRGFKVLPSAAAQAVPLRGERQEADGAGLQHEGELGGAAAPQPGAPAPRAGTASLAVIMEIHFESNTLTWFKVSFSLIFSRGILCSVGVEVHNFPGVLTFQAFCDLGGVAVWIPVILHRVQAYLV